VSLVAVLLYYTCHNDLDADDANAAGTVASIGDLSDWLLGLSVSCFVFACL